MSESRIHLNYWAILAAALATFCLEAAWYTAFQKPWLHGISSTREQLMNSGVSPALPYLTAFAMAVIIAAAISCTVQLTGAQTAMRGIRVGAAIWASFVFTTFATEYAFEVKPGLFGINAGFWLIGMMLTGAIVGGCRRKTSSGLHAVVTDPLAKTVSK